MFYVDASSRESATNSFGKIARIGNVEPSIEAAKNWLSNLKQPWLPVLDSFDDPQLKVEDYLPKGNTGFVLVTSWNPSIRVFGTIGSGYYHFGGLEVDDAIGLLLKIADVAKPYDLSATNSARAIAEYIGFLPLTLVFAGTTINTRLCSLKNYLTYYILSLKRTRQVRRDYQAEFYTQAYSAWDLLYNHVETKTMQEARDAVELLKLFPFFHNENIRFDIRILSLRRCSGKC